MTCEDFGGLARGARVALALCAGALLVIGAPACESRPPLPATSEPARPAPAPSDQSPRRQVFFDDFASGQMPRWEPMAGHWDAEQPGSGQQRYAALPREFALTLAGATAWSNYQIDAEITVTDDRHGPVGVVGRAQRSHHYFEFVIGRDPAGAKSWLIRQRVQHQWTTLAAGPLDYRLGVPYVVRFSLEGAELRALISSDRGQTFFPLGGASVPTDSWRAGKFGLVSYGGAAGFDDVSVSGGDFIALEVPPWGAVVELRDNTATFANRPSGGWFVTPIHATVRADGKVLITGFGRRAEAGCTGTTQREVGETWLLDPGNIDALSDGQTMFVTPINEQNLDPVHHVLYCAGHNTLADGRMFFSAGTDYPDTLPDSGPERGLTYSRIYNPTGTNGSFLRIAANMNGGQSITRGEKWYPTNLLMGDGRVLIFGGFHWSGGGPGTKGNYSLEMFDPKIWDANNAANPYTVLTQHEEGSSETPPTRGYTNLFLLPKPVPAGSAGGFARSVALAGGVGKVFLFNHEPGPTGAQRLLARTNALSPNPSTTEKGEGASGLLLTDGTIMFANGGHDGQGAQRVYFYNPYADSWSTLDTGISRMYGDAIQLPDGKVLLVNGYQGPGEPGNTTDITNPVGDIRQPTLVDPYATPRTATNLPAWPEPTHRGYHSIGVLLKDGRILIGGGKDADHATGCEKNELRIFDPPYLSAGPRPVIELPATEGSTITVGGAPITIDYSGTVRAVRGVVLMAPGSITHAFDSGQRYVPLTVLSGPNNTTGQVTVAAPSNINIAQPTDYFLFLISDAGVPSVARHVRLLPPAACVFAVDGNGSSYIEAEQRSRQDGPFVAVSDAGRSGGSYVRVTDGSGNHTTVPDEGKVMWYDVNVSNGGGFFIWALANGPDTNADTLWVSVDGNADTQLTLPANTWGWVRLNATALNIPSGVHTLKVKVREDGALIDKLLLTKDAGFTPSGLGASGLACNGTPAPTPPTGLVATAGNAQVVLSWNAVSGATSYTVKRATVSGGPYTNVPGGNVTTTNFTDLGLSNGTTYYYVVSATGAAGEGANSGQVAATPAAPGNWSSQDIGAVAAVGSFTQNGSQFTVRGSGADIYNAADEFRFGYQTVTGNASITARVATLCGGTPGTCPNVWTKAAVMLRDGTGAGARNVAALLSPTAANKFRLQYRTTANMGSTSVGSTPNSVVPAYLRVTRVGNVFTAFYSTNGTTFTQVGTPQTIAMPSTILAGLAVTSHADGTLATAVFDNVTVTSTSTPPGVPQGLTCVPGNGSCQLSWGAVGGATGYNVKRATTSGGPYVFLQSVTGTSFTDNTVSNGTTYFYVVSATNAAGESANSTQASCTPSLPPPPAPPTGVTCSSGNGQCVLGWNAVSGATGYNVKRAGGSGGPYSLVQTVTGTSFTDTTVTNGSTYFYVISANGPGGEGGNSSEVVCNPTAPQPPSAPINLGATGGAGQAALAFTDTANNETGFKIERKLAADPDTSFVQVATIGANVTAHTDTPLPAGTYAWRVRATNGAGDSSYSNVATATVTTPMGPAAPSNLGGTVAGGNAATLTWTDNASNETGFRVERKVGTGAYATLATKAANVVTHLDSGLAANTYTYRVIATGSPDSAPSNEVVIIISNPVADAYVRSGTSAGTNFGTAAVLDVKSTNTTTTKRNAFLRFSLGGVGPTVTSAKLRLYGNAVTSAKGAGVHSVADVTWSETGITWNTPTTDAGGPAMSPAALATQTVGLTAAYVEWDVTAYVQQQRNASASLVSLGVKSAVLSDEGQTTFNSREGLNKPLLIITSR